MQLIRGRNRKILIAILIVVLIIILGMQVALVIKNRAQTLPLTDKDYEELEKDKQKETSKEEKVSDNNYVGIEEQESEKQDQEEEKINEQENVQTNEPSAEEKAIELAKKEWGEDDSVTFKKQKNTGDIYIIGVFRNSDGNNLWWYKIDISTGSVVDY